ncbi:MAG: hypothetical protein J0L75_14910 [Spirochaetes bacterium]|nr:hypothetical protein [Spirochaetota bacterium]
MNATAEMKPASTIALWKDDAALVQKHYRDWWDRKGMVLNLSGPVQNRKLPRDPMPDPGPAKSHRDQVIDVDWVSRTQRYRLSRRNYPADNLPIAVPSIGPGSLALYLGSQPGFEATTVWYDSCIEDIEKHPPLVFDPDAPWCRTQEALVAACVRLSKGEYLTGCPDLIENIDILASLRGNETLMVDMLESPEWVKEKVAEINGVFFRAYQRIYDLIQAPDGSSAWAHFDLWGDGKTAKLQCDASAMFSTAMLSEFVVPALTEQCAWLDHSMYHLDGTQCIPHLDALLEVEPLDAIEWTPQAGLEHGGHRRWWPMYKRILDAGKSVQIIPAKKEEVVPLLDAIGGKGVFLYVGGVQDEGEAEAMIRAVEPYR